MPQNLYFTVLKCTIRWHWAHSVLPHHCVRLSCFSRVRLFVTLWTIAHQAPLAIGFSRQEYWSGLPCPPLGDLPDPGIELKSPALQADSLSRSHWGSPVPNTTFIDFQKLFITLQRNPAPTKHSLPAPALLAPGWYEHISHPYGFACFRHVIQMEPYSMILTSFTQHVYKLHPHCSVCQYFIPSYGWIIFHYIDIPYPVHPLISWHQPFPFE